MARTPTFGWPHAVIYINEQLPSRPPWMRHVLAPSEGLNAGYSDITVQ